MATSTTTLQKGPPFASKPPTAAAPTTPKPRPYKDFLTAALHRRFTSAAVFVLVVCYFEACLLRFPSIIWIWNPLSSTGARAFLLFTACLAVFIVRVANLHVGKLNTTSTAETVFQRCTSFNTLLTVGWYIYSGAFFGEIYIWSRSEGAGLGWVDYGNAYERPRLNENPLFLRSYMVCLSIAQAVMHLARGYDQVSVLDRAQGDDGKNPKESTGGAVKLLHDIFTQHIEIGKRILTVAVAFPLTLPVYFACIRLVSWPYLEMVAGIWFRDLPYTTKPPGLNNELLLIWQSLYATALLGLLWELSNAAFTFYVSLPPFKRGQPLTNEIKDTGGNLLSKSQDPNGSLLSGLKSTKEVPSSFAFWELWLVCDQFDARRKTIYSEVDRVDGSTWSQVCNRCLAEIELVKERIEVVQRPMEADEAAKGKQEQEKKAEEKYSAVVTLPRIGDRSVQNGDVLQKSAKPDTPYSVSNAARSLGQNPGSPNPIGPRARKALQWSTDRVLSEKGQARCSRTGLSNGANITVTRFMRTPAGDPFRETFARKVCAVIFGVPHSARVNIIHASRSLVKLAICSLKEDDFGQVAPSIARIVRAYVSTITDINKFVAALSPSWTDANFADRDRRVPEVEELLREMKGGLEEVLLAFGEYASTVGITKKELREAREVLGRGSEMSKV